MRMNPQYLDHKMYLNFLTDAGNYKVFLRTINIIAE